MAGRKTSNPCWQTQLGQKLKPPADTSSIHLAVVGIGNEFGGDDAAGIVAARTLLEKYKDQPGLLVLDCGQVLENASGPLRKFQPDLVILVDAAEMGLEPGKIDILDPHKTSGYSASSHTLPISVMAEYIENEFDSPVVLCGIQPASLEFGTDLSDPVKNAVERVVKEITFWINEK